MWCGGWPWAFGSFHYCMGIRFTKLKPGNCNVPVYLTHVRDRRPSGFSSATVVRSTLCFALPESHLVRVGAVNIIWNWSTFDSCHSSGKIPTRRVYSRAEKARQSHGFNVRVDADFAVVETCRLPSDRTLQPDSPGLIEYKQKNLIQGPNATGTKQ